MDKALRGKKNTLFSLQFEQFYFVLFCTRTWYKTQPLESNSLKCSSIQMVHLIELKIGMYIYQVVVGCYLD